MNICVIGGSGFIGTSLCKKFKKEKIKFSILDINKSIAFPQNFKFSDVRSYEKLLKTINNSEIIVNLAAEHRDNVLPLSLYHDVNVLGAKNVCEVAEAKNINTIVFTSSVAVYGFTSKPCQEKTKINPFNEYGITKRDAENIYINWQRKNPRKRRLIIIRPTVVFGEGNRGNVYNLLKQIASKSFVMIGDGKNKKSIAYVENVASFLYFSLNFKRGIHIYNYTDPPDLTMNELILRIKSILGLKKVIKYRVPFFLAYAIGKTFDLVSFLSNKKFTISAIRVKKFC